MDAGKSQDLLSRLTPAKVLALGCYGEDMAAYRYLLLSEKCESAAHRQEFSSMVTEEQEHRQRLQGLLDKYYPGEDFVLAAEEKLLVEGGNRKLQITDRASFEEAFRTAIQAEYDTAQFYDTMEARMEHDETRALFRELADEGVEHHRHLLKLAEENGIPQ